jgi:diguanylate cyclase (GGDEF)-like protein
MNSGSGPRNSSTHTDPRVLATLGALQSASLFIIAVVAGTVLCAWYIPPLGRLLPSIWSVMKADTAAVALLGGLSVILNQPRRSPTSILIARLIGLAVFLVASEALCEHLLGISFKLSALLKDDTHAPLPGRMSVQSAASFLLLGIVLACLRVTRKPLAYIIDSVTVVLSLLILIFASGFAFDLMGLFGTPMQHRLSPQTLLCLILLTFLVFNRRTEYGSFSVMIDNGIGGKTARLAAPFALLLPFAVSVIYGLVTRSQWVPEQYGVELSSAFIALVSFCFVVVLSWRCNRLEQATLQLSLRDQLTQLYNRRGFYLLAEQSRRLTSRAGASFFLLFIDMDNLKQLNDDFGHEAGSDRLREMASLLEKTFRASDVIGRIGGDEFVIAGTGTAEHVIHAINRLQKAAASFARPASGHPPLSFSLGYTIAPGGSTEPLDTLVQKADLIMYEAKRARKTTPPGPPKIELPSAPAPTTLASALTSK